MGKPPGQKFFEFSPLLRKRGMMEVVITIIVLPILIYNSQHYHLLPKKQKPLIAERPFIFTRF